jgi:Leucine-rich repeat (LRR) protein
LAKLKGLTSPTLLSIDDTQVSDTGIEHLKGLPTLETLALHNTQITDVGLEHIKELANLGYLTLGGVPVTDERGTAPQGTHKSLAAGDQ